MTKRTRVFQSGSRLALWLVTGLIGFGLFAGGAAHAETSVTNTLSGATNTTNLVIGNSGNFNYWTIPNAASLMNTGPLLVGSNTTARNNSLILTNGGQLFNSGPLRVGQQSSNNVLAVLGGATPALLNNGGFNLVIGYSTINPVGAVNHAGNNNLLRIDGGIVTNVNDLYVGLSVNTLSLANTNALLLANGGQLFTKGAYFGYQAFAGTAVAQANANAGTVTGNSLWDNGGGVLHVGLNARDYRSPTLGNSLWVETGSVVTNLSFLQVGGDYGARDNRLVITNGGRVFVTGSLVIGNGTGAFVTPADPAIVRTFNNSVVVMGGPSGDSLLNLGGGGLTNGWIGSATVTTANHYGSNNVVRVDAGGVLTNVGAILVGALNYAGAGNANWITDNALIITNGGRLFSGNVTIGQGTSTGAGSSNNFYTIGGAGARTVVSNGVITIGATNARSNRLDVVNADVQSTGLTIGSLAYFNTATIRDSTFTNSGAVAVGANAGNSNTLTVTNSTVSVAGGLTVGNGSLNTLTILGATTWDNNDGGITLGTGTGSGNSLVLDAGGVAGGAQILNAGAVVVGQMSNTFGNTLTLINGGRLAGGLITVGTNSAGNALDVLAGTRLDASGQAVRVGIAGGTAGQSIPASNNTLRINGGVLTNAGQLFVGYSTGVLGSTLNNALIITNGGRLLTTDGLVGYSALASSSSLTISNNTVRLSDQSTWNLGAGNLSIGRNTADIRATPLNNSVWVETGSVLTNLNNIDLGVSTYSSGNALIISNGGRVFAQGNLVLGAADSAPIGATPPERAHTYNNYLLIAGGPAGHSRLDLGGGNLSNGLVGVSGSFSAQGSNNVIRVAAGGTLTNVGTIVIGQITSPGRVDVFDSDYTRDNQLIITNGGQVYASRVDVGNGVDPGASNNFVRISTGSLLEANTLVANASGGGNNTFRNDGGIYQFTTTPVLTPNGAGNISVTDGTIAFRATTNASVATISGLTYHGTNTFRLNNASNTGATAGSQTYTFNAITANPTNYARLEMLNGTTAYDKGNVTVGATGSMLLSNTRATITGVFTNHGTFTSFNSVGTFHSAVVNHGAWITDPTTNVFLANHTITGSGSLAMSATDVFIFKGDFVNQSTQNTTYDTLAGKFLFDGGSQTQLFATAGKDFGPGWLFQSPLNSTNELAGPHWGGGPTFDNFALLTLEISNFSTVRVSDAFSLLNGNDDNQRGALYIQNLWLGQSSFLIVDTNVSVYFRYTNDWAASGAGYTLFGDGELHQLTVIPEPSILLLCVSGFAMLWWRRRRSTHG